MKVALIGGTGFVGSYLIDELISDEHTPRLLVRKNSDYKVMQSDKCEIITGDIDNDNALEKTLGKKAKINFLSFSLDAKDVPPTSFVAPYIASLTKLIFSWFLKSLFTPYLARTRPEVSWGFSFM